jgi:hypothetical protein
MNKWIYKLFKQRIGKAYIIESVGIMKELFEARNVLKESSYEKFA